jgi:hypothetical protein
MHTNGYVVTHVWGGGKLRVNAKAEAWIGNVLKLISPVTDRGKELKEQWTP